MLSRRRDSGAGCTIDLPLAAVRDHRLLSMAIELGKVKANGEGIAEEREEAKTRFACVERGEGGKQDWRVLVAGACDGVSRFDTGFRRRKRRFASHNQQQRL